VVSKVAVVRVLHRRLQRDRLVYLKLVLLCLRLVEARQLLVLFGQLVDLVQPVRVDALARQGASALFLPNVARHSLQNVRLEVAWEGAD